MTLNLSHLIKMHRAILTSTEKKYFFILSMLFLFVSCFDIVGIGAIGYFLLVMMNPDLLHNIPIIHAILPPTWSVSNTLIALGATILCVFLFKTVSSCLVQKYLITYCFKVGARIRNKLMEQCLYAPYTYFVTNHTSDMISQILTYASTYSSLSLVSFMTILVHSFFVIAIVTFLLVLHPVVTLLLILMFAIILALHLFIVKDRLYEAGEKVNLSNRQIVQSVQEGLIGIKEVRVLGKEQFFLNRLQEASKLNAEANGFIGVFQKLPFYFLESGMFIAIISMCLTGLLLGQDVKLIVALCGTLVTAGARLLPSLYLITSSITSAQSSQHALEIIYQHLHHSDSNSETEKTWPKKTLELNKHSTKKDFSNITFEKVSYRYERAHKPAINEVSLTIKKGQSIGIIGPSGAGKSTLIDILLGLLTPSHGKILMDGIPINNKAEWVSRFAYIPQSLYLLDNTIKNNIIFGEPENHFDEQSFTQALKMAQLEEVVANLPKGVDTIIGENGIKLSGGQRQRVGLARAFYHERNIIVMDEATASLDNQTEHEVVKALKELHQLKTLIIIAHRYSTVEHCDVIYRLENGKIIEEGTYHDVIGKEQKLLTTVT